MSAFTDLTQLLEQDRGTPHPKYPEQALYALRDKVVAEAVEPGHQANTLRDLHCDHAQGWLFGAPMSATDLAAWVGAQVMPVVAIVRTTTNAYCAAPRARGRVLNQL